ncbi:Transposable element P transposase [Orchesella cincta]|uniref:Transposable element P transposase n=1 Tax=Orchesella cincta TaxID=48709 RepID=A0A1D2MST2_ORCCI|nr:Transposable element P transposase [Orchesella cincta]
MGRRCAITSCYNYGKKPIDTIHSFPTWNPFQRLQWLEYVKMTSKLKVAEVNLDNFGLCCRHFHHEAYNITKSELKSNQIWRSGTLKDYAVPSKLTSSENVAIYDYMRVQTGISNDHDYCLNNHNIFIQHNLSIMENASLKWKIEDQTIIIEKKNKEIKKPSTEHDKTLLKNVKEKLTLGQIRLLSDENVKKVNWNDEDKSKAIGLWAASSKGYQFMRDVIQMPLPAPRSVYRWLQEVPVYPDQMIVPSMNILKSKLEKATHMTRLCCIAIDEMSIDPLLL